MTRATNLMRARKCQELLPEAKVYKDKFNGIANDKRYANYWRECQRKKTPIPNGPVPTSEKGKKKPDPKPNDRRKPTPGVKPPVKPKRDEKPKPKIDSRPPVKPPVRPKRDEKPKPKIDSRPPVNKPRRD